MTSRSISLASALIVSLWFGLAQADDLSNQPPDRDTYINAAAPNQNYGTSSVVQIRTNVSGFQTAAVLHWNLSSIPQNATVNNVALVFHRSAYQSSPMVAGVGRVDNSWTETGATFNNISGTAIGSASIDTSRAYPMIAFESGPILTMVQNWVSNPSANYGMVVVQPTPDPHQYFDFYSKEGDTFPARISINYSVPCDPPGAFTLLYPGNGNVISGTSTTLSWLTASGATQYDVYFGTSSNPPLYTNTGETSLDVSSLSLNTTYYWKVVAKNTCGNTADSSGTWHFRTGACGSPPGSFALLSPSNGTTISGTSTTLSWGTAWGVTSYDVYFGTSSNPPLYTNTGGTSLGVSGLSLNTTYYWKVVAKNTCGNTADSSGTWSFTTPVCMNAPGAFALLSPGNGSTIGGTSTTLSWGTASGVTSYDVYFGTSQTPPLYTNTGGTSLGVSGLNLNTTYYWKVVAKNSCGYTNDSSGTWHFTTPACTNPPGSFALLSPSSGSTIGGTSTTLSWGTASEATSYDVYFGTSSNPPLYTNTGGTSLGVSGLSLNTTYYWKVVAKNSCSDTTDSSGIWHFTTPACTNPPGSFALLSPGDGSTISGTSTTLSWGTASEATSYDVYFGTSSNPPLYTNTGGTSLGVSGLSLNTTYYWKVVAKNSCSDTTDSSGTWHFALGSCSYIVSPTSISFGASGGSASISVSAGVGCAWQSTSTGSWITFTSVTTGSGDGSVTVTVAPNNVGSSPRSGTVVVADRTVAVYQAKPGTESPPIGHAGGYVYIIPGCAHSPGLGGTSWISDLVLQNPATTQAVANIYLMRSGLDNSTTAGREFAVPAQGSLKISDVVQSAFSELSTAGALLIGANQPLVVSSRTFNNAAAGTFGQYISGASADQGISQGQKVRLIQLTKDTDYRTNIGFANASATSLVVEVKLYQSNGGLIGTKSYGILPFGYLQDTDIIGGLTGADVADAYAIVSSLSTGAKYFTYASVIDYHSGDPITIIPPTMGSGAIYVPGVAALAGAAGTNWMTDLEVHNPGSTQAAFSVSLLVRDEANPSPLSRSFNLGPGQSIRYPNVLQAMFGFSGAATLRITLTSGQVVASARTYNNQPQGTYGQFIAGAPESTAISYGQEGLLVQLAQSNSDASGFRTNLGLVNVAPVTISVNIDLYRGDGTLLGTGTYSLRANESKQIDRVFRNVPSSDVSDGFAVLRTTSSSGRFFAYASVVDNRSGDPVFVPAVPGAVGGSVRSLNAVSLSFGSPSGDSPKAAVPCKGRN